MFSRAQPCGQGLHRTVTDGLFRMRQFRPKLHLPGAVWFHLVAPVNLTPEFLLVPAAPQASLAPPSTCCSLCISWFVGARPAADAHASARATLPRAADLAPQEVPGRLHRGPGRAAAQEDGLELDDRRAVAAGWRERGGKES